MRSIIVQSYHKLIKKAFKNIQNLAASSGKNIKALDCYLEMIKFLTLYSSFFVWFDHTKDQSDLIENKTQKDANH